MVFVLSYFSHLPRVTDLYYMFVCDGHEKVQNSVSVLVPVKGQCSKFQLDFVQARLQLVTDPLLTILQNSEVSKVLCKILEYFLKTE